MYYVVVKEVCETLIKLGYLSTEIEIVIFHDTISIKLPEIPDKEIE